MSGAWYETFFEGLLVEAWDRLVPEAVTRAEADLLERLLGVRPGARLLDVPCGSGRLSIELARRGYRVTGVDLSRAMLRRASEAAAAASVGSRVELRQGDMGRLPPLGQHDGALCMGNSFGYLDREGDDRFLMAMARSLSPGARLVIDAPTCAECLLPTFEPRMSIAVGDLRLEAEGRHDALSGRLETSYVARRAGREQKARASQAVYTVAEVGRMLASAGLTLLSAVGSLEGRPFQLGDRRLFLVAERCRAELPG